jgi:DNA processing protein
VPGIGPARFSSLLQHFGSARKAWQASPRALAVVLDTRSVEAMAETRRQLDPVRAAEAIVRAGFTTLTWEDPGYPALLRQIGLPPFVLYAAGNVALLAERAVAVVGTRRPTLDGQRAARELGRALAEQTLVVVSGLARGIDAEAHRAALPVGRTVAVLGTGLDTAYPAENRSLQRNIAQSGALVTEYPPRSSSEPGNFLARNRIISGLCLATVVVEAGEKSGALSTANQAAEQGRDVLAVPGSIFSPQSVGTNRLLATGAGVCRGAQDVLEALQLPVRKEPVRLPPAAADPRTQALLAALATGPVHIDALARATGLGAAEVARGLSELELSGHAEHLGQMLWTAR